MKFQEWARLRADQGLFDAELIGRFRGEPAESPFSGIRYLYAEAIGEDPKQGNQSITHTQSNLILIVDGYELELSWRLIRPYLKESYREALSAESFNAGQFIFRHLVEKDTTEIVLTEYGLREDHDYYIRLEKEFYQLPPGPGSPEPIEKSNTILAIREVPAQDSSAELTPVFRQWSY